MDNIEQTQGSSEGNNPELTIQDLNNLRAIIDVASQRGAFRAPELEAVGNTYNKLDTFLKAAMPAEQADAPGTQG